MTAPPGRVAVIGGGVTGLAAAHRLIEEAAAGGRPVRVTLLEASGRAGGVVSTRRRDGFLLEEGPDSMISDKPWGVRLAERLDLGDRLTGTLEAHRRSFVVRRGRLVPTPDGFYLMAPTRLMPLVTTRIFSPLGKARMAMDLLLPRRPPAGDESVASFVRRRLGREALERMAQPMIAGIYGADPETLSLQATFPRFIRMEQDEGSVIRAMLAAGRRRATGTAPQGARGSSGPRYGLFVSLEGGLQQLTDALAARLPPGSLRTGARVTGLLPSGSPAWKVAVAGETEPQEHDAVILALHAPDAAALLRPFDRELSEEVGAIHYASAATVSVAVRESQVAHPLDGFGFVVPAIERRSIIGCTFAHRKYPGRAPAGWALLRAFIGEPVASLPPAGILSPVMADLRELLGISGEPAFTHVSVWERSMPHYRVGHLERVARIEELAGRHCGLALAGNAYRGVGVPDCIRSGEEAAERILASAAPDPAYDAGGATR